ncbi:hypothetical protein [uncultured Ruegeria sp.]|uniref:hypothetical protein n=1 Tax=uncultured Ruegeria sp. TaxID=259304 RepID=UPI00260A69ED|nr:hypothetical protein [uncultured Ruegeria sp.]
MTIHRRTMLKSSLPLLAGAIATGAAAGELLDDNGQTPIQSLYTAWADLGNRYGNALDENDALPDHRHADDHYKECVEPICDEFLALEHKMMELPSQDFKDLAIKARISARTDGVIDDNHNRLIRADADRILGSVNL